MSFCVLNDFFRFSKKIGLSGILGPPYCGIGATIRIGREMLCLPYAGFFPKSFTHILKNYNLKLQGLQIEAFQQRYSKCKCETPYLEGELRFFFNKKNKKIYPEWFGY